MTETKQKLGIELSDYVYNEIMLRWEWDLSGASGFDVRNSQLLEFLSSSGIGLVSYKSDKEANQEIPSHKKGERDLFIDFSDRKSSQAQSIFYHLRNCFAHGRFKFDGAFLELEDMNQNKLTMRARFRVYHLKPLIAVLQVGAKPKVQE